MNLIITSVMRWHRHTHTYTDPCCVNTVYKCVCVCVWSVSFCCAVCDCFPDLISHSTHTLLCCLFSLSTQFVGISCCQLWCCSITQWSLSCYGNRRDNVSWRVCGFDSDLVTDGNISEMEVGKVVFVTVSPRVFVLFVFQFALRSHSI